MIKAFSKDFSSSIMKVFENFVLTKEKLLVPVKVVVKSISDISSSGINLIGMFLRNSDMDEQALIVYDPKDYSLLGVNKTCVIKYGINTNFTYEVN